MFYTGVWTSMYMYQTALHSDSEIEHVRACVRARAWSREDFSNYFVQFPLFSKKADAERGLFVAQELIANRQQSRVEVSFFHV